MKKEVLSFFLFLLFARACPFKAMAVNVAVNVSSADELVAIANQYAATAGADEQNITLTADMRRMVSVYSASSLKRAL